MYRLILGFILVTHIAFSQEIGTPLSSNAKKILICGGGELAKELVIELQRFGVEVIVIDRYPNAPAMQLAHRSYVLSMLDGSKLRDVILKENPDHIVPEIEAIDTQVLVDLEESGFNVTPNAKAVQLTMNRKAIRCLAAEKLGLVTSPYRFAQNKEECITAIKEISLPCVIKPIMSSSGKGQSIVHSEEEIEAAWEYSQSGGRTGQSEIIVEKFIDFDYEITLLTATHRSGTTFCAPIGHTQVNGDYRQSWQPHPMQPHLLKKAEQMAHRVTQALDGYGIFGVEMFVKGEEIYFSEVSPRPHDTGMVTLISQNLSEFAIHARAILGIPIPKIELYGPSASSALVVHGISNQVVFKNIDQALHLPNTELRLFGKPNVSEYRRMGVGLARGKSITEALEKAMYVTQTVDIQLSPVNAK